MIIATITASGVLVLVVYVLALVGLAVIFLLLNDRIFHRRLNRKEMAAFSKRFEERLLQPDIQTLEQHFGHALPKQLKALYEDRGEILKGDFEVVGNGLQRTESHTAGLRSLRDRGGFHVYSLRAVSFGEASFLIVSSDSSRGYERCCTRFDWGS